MIEILHTQAFRCPNTQGTHTCPPPATNYTHWDQSLRALNLKLYVPHFIVTASHADGVSLPHYIHFSK